jgi:O-antigen/teichoic acid export membrane protein
MTAPVDESTVGGAPAGTGRSMSGKAMTGMAWTGLGYGTQGVGQIVVLGLLSRYMTAAEFGVISATLLVVGFGRLFTQSVVGPAVVQRAELTERHVQTAAWIALAGGVVMAALTAASAPIIEGFFRFDDLAPVLVALSVMFVVQAPSVVAEALLQRDLQFRRLAIADSISFLVGYCGVGVTLAVLDQGVWALVAANIAQVLLRTIMLLRACRTPLLGRGDRESARHILHFGTGFTMAKVLNYVAGQGDYFVIGRWMSADALGNYGRAYQLVGMPAQLIGQVMDRVLFPMMAKFQNDKPRLADSYRRGVELTTVLMAPISGFAVVMAPEIIHTILGSQWDAVVDPFRVLVAGLVFRTGYKISDSLARSTGAVYKRAARQAVYAGLVVVGALIGKRWGITGVAWGVLGAILVNYLAMAQLSLESTGLSWFAFARVHVRGAVLALATAAVAFALRSAFAADMNEVVVLLATAGVVGGLLTIGVLCAPRLAVGADAHRMLISLKGRLA